MSPPPRVQFVDSAATPPRVPTILYLNRPQSPSEDLIGVVWTADRGHLKRCVTWRREGPDQTVSFIH